MISFTWKELKVVLTFKVINSLVMIVNYVEKIYVMIVIVSIVTYMYVVGVACVMVIFVVMVT